MIQVIEERMSDEFTKHHLRGLPFDAVLHHFTSIAGENAHDHPFRFTSHVLSGSYIERVYSVGADGSWGYTDIERKAGTSHIVEAECIHEIISLPEGECWTAITPQKKTRDPGFWRFETDAIWFKPWNGEAQRIH